MRIAQCFALALIAICSAFVHAETLEAFDRWEVLSQAEYITTFLDAAEEVIRSAGMATAADKLTASFIPERSTAGISFSGPAAVERQMRAIRKFDLERREKDPKAKPLDVGLVMVRVIEDKAGIELSDELLTKILRLVDDRYPQTFAQFEKLTPTAQRRTIALLLAIGMPIVVHRQHQDDHQKEGKSLWDDQEVRQDLFEILVNEYSGQQTDQAGSDKILGEIRECFLRTPNASGPVVAVYHVVMSELDAKFGRDIQKMRDETLHIPN